MFLEKCFMMVGKFKDAAIEFLETLIIFLANYHESELSDEKKK